ncbi:uncharacterized protein zfhx2 isoform X1 [Gadus macrocephalus]|uniref:uncharacterized protein zfhx2 isoform X1 n=2 Tax=Gadus macrocephalus TaxID=80720 RepID=UPI0028CB5293|nr:uncharacterized protein zfhx2 isoform X1 [Gadus macrocephalus]
MQEESGEILCRDSHRVAGLLCPLCQQGLEDRSCLALHLTAQHNVLQTCVEKLLDIAVLKQCANPGDHESDTMTSTVLSDAASLPNLKPADPPSSQASESEGDADEARPSKEQNVDMAEDRDPGDCPVQASPPPSCPVQSEPKGPAGPDGKAGPGAAERVAGEKPDRCPAPPENAARSFKCTACIETFPTKTALSVHYNATSHIQRMTLGAAKQGVDSETQTARVPLLSRPFVSNKPYQCAVCRVSYNHAITLESHMKSVLHQTRSISAGNVAAGGGGSGGVPGAAVATTSSGAVPLLATTTSCQVSGLSGNLMVMAKDGEQIRVSQAAPSLLSSPVTSAQAVSAFLTLLTSSPSALPHSLLPSVFPGAAAPPPMLMPLILNGGQAHQQADGVQGQILTQCVPLMGLSAAQQALVTQRLGSLQNQWSSMGMQATAQLCQEAQNPSVKAEGGPPKQEADGGPASAPVDIKQEPEGGGLEENKPSLTPSDRSLRHNSLSPSASVHSSCSLSPVTLNLALSPDSTPQKSQPGTSPANALCSPFRNAPTPSEQARPYVDTRAPYAHPVPPALSEFQSEVLWAFFESRSEAEAASPPREDCEALGKEVGIPEAEVRRWLGQARQAKERQRAERSGRAPHAKRPRPAGSDRGYQDDDDDDDDDESALVIAEDGAVDHAEGQAMDLSSRGKKKRGRGLSSEGQGDSCLTSDSENGAEVGSSVLVSEEESRNASRGPWRASPVKQAQRAVSRAHQSSGGGGGKVLRSTTVFLSDAEDEYDEEEGASGRRRKNERKRKMFEPDAEVKRERLDSDVDLELEAQGDPPSAQHHAMDPMGLVRSLPLSLSLSPFSAQLLSPYVLSLPSALVGDAGKVQSFPNPPNISHFSDPLLAQTLSSLGQTPLYMANGDDGESALDLSMGKNGSSKSAPASSSSSLMADLASTQKGRLLDGLGLRPTSKGLVVVQVKSEPLGVMSAAHGGGGGRLVGCHSGPKSSIYMRAAEKVNAALLDKEREKERENEKDQQLQRRSKGKRYRDMRRSRTIIQAEQLDILYGCYFKDPNPGKHEFEQISEWVHLPKKVVQIWFQNMRARERKGEVRFISDGTLAAVGKPLIKFTWPLSKPIFSNKTSSNNAGCVTAAPIVRTLMTDKEALKELSKLTWVKKQTPIPIKPKEIVSSSPSPSSSSSTKATPVDSSVSAVSKVKLETTTSNVTKAHVAPKAAPPAVPPPTPPKDPVHIAPRPLLTPKAEEESEEEEEEEKTDDELESENEVAAGAPNRMVPKLTPSPVCGKPPAAVAAPAPQKQNGLNYWSGKSSFKINTLSREQLALPPPPPPSGTIPPPPTPSIAPVSPNSRCTAKMAVLPLPAKSSPADGGGGGFLSHSSSRRPRTHLSCLQLSILQSCYETCAHPNAMECEAIGAELSLPLKVVQIWFQNTRAKEKRWKLQQEKMSPLMAGKVDTSSGSYLQYNALRANRPILPKPVQLTVIEPAASPVAGQPVPKESLTGRCEACSASFESRAAARTHVFSPRHLATLRTTNFGQPATLVNKNGGSAGGSGNGGGGGGGGSTQAAPPALSVPSSGSSGRASEGEAGGEAPPPKASSNS